MRILLSRSIAVLCLLALSVFAVPLHAAVAIVRSDETMFRMAPAIVTGTVIETFARLNERGDIETVTRILVDETIKGNVPADRILDLVQFGGALNGRFEAASGEPKYETGERYLVVLDRDGRGNWTTFDLALGQFHFIYRSGNSFLHRDTTEIAGWTESGEPFNDFDRPASLFIALAKDNAKQPPQIATTALKPVSLALNYDLSTVTPSAVGKWSAAESAMNDSVSNTAASDDTLNLGDGESRVIADDPHCEISGKFTNSGVVAQAFWGGSGTSNFNGETYAAITVEDVIVNDGVYSSAISSGDFLSAMVHEFGHTRGFRHSDQTGFSGGTCSSPLPCSSTAIMNHQVVNGLNGALQSWDLDAANMVYGNHTRQATFTGAQYSESGDPQRRPGNTSWRIWNCHGPQITTQPSGSTIAAGNQATLSVASGCTSTYQWYVGNPPSTSNPVPSGTTASIQVSPPSTTTYWVRVSNSCGNVDSNAATVTVTGGGCNNPTITTQPSGSTIQSGNSATLSVVASGTGPLSYQWYTGNPPSTANPVPGGTTASIQVSPTSTTSYWVRVTNNCPGSADSNAATVTIGCPTVTVGNPTSTDLGNGSFQLSVTASGGTGLTYQWFQGSVPGSGPQVGTGNPFTVTNITSSTSFWVRVTNSCPNSTDSRNVVTVGPTTCNPPSVLSQPQDQSVLVGGTVQLSVGVLGTAPFSFSWFQGAPPDTSAPVGNAQTITSPVITANTTFYARITNNCGTATSRTVAITATQTCVAPSITSVSANPQTAAPGTQITLTVAATGTGLTYQWYRGASGDTSNPISGATSASITDSPAATTSYWVKVSSGCGAAAANSNAVTVTITVACVPPSIVQPANSEVIFGQKATLTVQTTAGSDPLHYSWFMGARFDTSHPIGTDSPTVTTPSALTQDTQFFVNVSNSCGNVNSETITVKVQLPRRRPTKR